LMGRKGIEPLTC